jgi:hypothetical protein
VGEEIGDLILSEEDLTREELLRAKKLADLKREHGVIRKPVSSFDRTLQMLESDPRYESGISALKTPFEKARESIVGLDPSDLRVGRGLGFLGASIRKALLRSIKVTPKESKVLREFKSDADSFLRNTGQRGTELSTAVDDVYEGLAHIRGDDQKVYELIEDLTDSAIDSEISGAERASLWRIIKKLEKMPPGGKDYARGGLVGLGYAHGGGAY